MINTGEQNKPNAPSGRSILDYSLIACFTLVVLMLILVLDAFEYISVPGASSARGKLANISGAGAVTSDELEEVQKQIEQAKTDLEAKKAEVEKIVTKVEEEIKDEKTPTGKVETPEEKAAEEKKEEEVVEAVVEKELGIDKFCGGCRYGAMSFTCAQRVEWMMDSYGITEDMAKRSALNKCHYRRLRGGPNGN